MNSQSRGVTVAANRVSSSARRGVSGISTASSYFCRETATAGRAGDLVVAIESYPPSADHTNSATEIQEESPPRIGDVVPQSNNLVEVEGNEGIGSPQQDGNKGDDKKFHQSLTHKADRLITFTDAVVEIAMTLLILPLMDASDEPLEWGGGEGQDQEQSSSSAGRFFSENSSNLGLRYFLLGHLIILERIMTASLGM